MLCWSERAVGNLSQKLSGPRTQRMSKEKAKELQRMEKRLASLNQFQQIVALLLTLDSKTS